MSDTLCKNHTLHPNHNIHSILIISYTPSYHTLHPNHIIHSILSYTPDIYISHTLYTASSHVVASMHRGLSVWDRGGDPVSRPSRTRRALRMRVLFLLLSLFSPPTKSTLGRYRDI
eukprot:GHVO01013853.1.p1 GENE.GHVO01013853.1~~GHVO01013853.1.p1  ORF type:complete len:116 (-),score=14.23 GHVO01013853.1:21-368(-)